MMRRNWKIELPLHLMLVPGLVLVLLFCYGPMAGILIAFQNYIPVKGITGSEWIVLEHFRYVYSLPETMTVFRNTVVIASMSFFAISSSLGATSRSFLRLQKVRFVEKLIGSKRSIILTLNADLTFVEKGAARAIWPFRPIHPGKGPLTQFDAHNNTVGSFLD